MKKIAHFVMLATLSGCATWGQMDDGLTGLHGHSIDEAIRLIGYPASEKVIAGRRIFTWSSNSMGTIAMPQTSYSQGNVYAGGVSSAYYATTTSTAYMPVSYYCSISLEVSESGLIVGHQYDGNLGGCSGFINALKPVADRRGGANPTSSLDVDTVSRLHTNQFYIPKNAANEPVPDGRGLQAAQLKVADTLRKHSECIKETAKRLAKNGAGTAQSDAELTVLLCSENADQYESAVYYEASISGSPDAIKFTAMLRNDLNTTSKSFAQNIIEEVRRGK
ncbi:hypothetical protein AB6N01_20610 [Alcaligenes nematophilus]|uniref:hypothetical protein n=1 Tax=Alcaligenes nematophilus TaxID=2994643 RepID=UPI0034E06D2A